MTTVLKPADLFALDIIAPVLEGFQRPAEAFAPAGAWVHQYALYTLAHRVWRVGRVRLARTPRPDGCLLNLTYEKTASGEHVQRLTAEIEAASNRLATPRGWRYVYEMFDKEGKALPGSRFEGAGSPAKLGAASPCTLSWCLFDAVQRLPRERFEALPFTLIDHFDQVKPENVLTFREPVTVLLGERREERTRVEELEKDRIHKAYHTRVGGEEVLMRAYGQTGRGIVPWVYWVDDKGRLLFAVAGLEAYVWEMPA